MKKLNKQVTSMKIDLEGYMCEYCGDNLGSPHSYIGGSIIMWCGDCDI